MITFEIKRDNLIPTILMLFGLGLVILPLLDLIILLLNQDPTSSRIRTTFWLQESVLAATEFSLYYYSITILMFGNGLGVSLAKLSNTNTDQEKIINHIIYKQNSAYLSLFVIFLLFMVIFPLILASIFYDRGFFIIYYYIPTFVSLLIIIFFSFQVQKEKKLPLKILFLLIFFFMIFLGILVSFLLIFGLGSILK